MTKMKKSLLSIIFTTLIACMVFAQSKTAAPTQSTAQPPQEEGLKWYNWNDGFPKALAGDKILLIDIYTDWCGWCKKMDRDTYSKKDIMDLINKHFIAVKFNPEKTAFMYDLNDKKVSSWDLYAQLVQNQRSGYPTTVFLYPKEGKVYILAGYQDEANFKQTLNNYIGLKSGK
jgi:uncharacterized protein YyaL (SSP411 family)